MSHGQLDVIYDSAIMTLVDSGVVRDLGGFWDTAIFPQRSNQQWGLIGFFIVEMIPAGSL
jgi:hypothetical protein